MSREWQPGDVALVTSTSAGSRAWRTRACAEFETVIGVRTGKAGKPGGWNQADGHWIADEYVYEARPLVVIDPEDREQVERLLAPHVKPFKSWVNDSRIEHMQAALRSLLAPPKPDEPTGLGAVVEDEDGERWVRVNQRTGTQEWRCCVIGEFRRWPAVNAVRVLSEGVTP